MDPKLFIFTVIITFASLICSTTSQLNVHYLAQDDTFRFGTISKFSPREFHIFCYEGKPKSIVYIWQSVSLQIKHSTDDYTQFDGQNPEIVHNAYVSNKETWSVNIFSTSKPKNMKLDPFNQSCVGIDSKDIYTVHLNIIRVDFWKVLSLAVGLFLFISAEKLSNNTVFHYLCGVTFGICASFLILIYFISKIFPRKPLMYGVLGCGWTIVIYFLQILWENLQVIMLNYKSYIIWYTVMTGIISFFLCYRWGPVENKRTINLIKWSLQTLGLISIYLSSHFQEAAMGQIVMLLLFRIMPQKWVSAPKTYWKKKFPPKVQLLTNDEYYEQGVRETTKALQELKKYCSSPECNQWKTALKLKDVKRFASFVEGNSHLSDDEILEYETSIHGELTDDEAQEFSEDEDNR